MCQIIDSLKEEGKSFLPAWFLFDLNLTHVKLLERSLLRIILVFVISYSICLQISSESSRQHFDVGPLLWSTNPGEAHFQRRSSTRLCFSQVLTSTTSFLMVFQLSHCFLSFEFCIWSLIYLCRLNHKDFNFSNWNFLLWWQILWYIPPSLNKSPRANVPHKIQCIYFPFKNDAGNL